MRESAFAVAVLLALNGAAAAEPFSNFFDDEEPRPPVARDCDTVGAAGWHGEFSGKRYDTFNDKYYPYAARGCFDSELECRIWQQRAITYTIGGPIYYTRCGPGGG
jgi:hypothetical protein